MSVFPLNIPEKTNTPALLAFFQQFGLDKYLSAEEINKITEALTELKEASANVSIVNTIFVNNGFEKVDQLFTAFANSEWNINGINYTNPTDQVITIPLCATGKVRTDRIVLDTNNNFVRVPGVEVDENPVAEAKPVNTLDYTFIPVNDAEVGDPSSPVIGNIYQQKQFDYLQTYIGSGTDVVIPLNTDGRSHIQLKGTMTSIAGLSFADLVANPTNAEYPHYGKRFLFFNDSGHDIILKHLVGTEDIFFTFKEETDLVFPNGEFLEFFKGSNVFVNVFRSWKDINSISGLPEILDLKADLVAGKVPASQLPSYVDDVLEFTNLAGFPATGEAGKIYLALDTNFTYRWTGSVYLKISDTGKLDKVTTTGVERFYKINPDGTQGAKPISDILAGEIQLPAYPSSRNDGANPNNKVLNVDASGNLKLYSMSVMPPPYLEELIPYSYLPSTTGNFIIKGSFFTPTTTVTVEGQTLNYITFVSDNEMLVNLTTGATEGTFDVTINNGTSVVFENALLVILGDVFTPTDSDYTVLSGNVDTSVDGEIKVEIENIAGAVEFYNIPNGQDFRVNFRIAKSPINSLEGTGLNSTKIQLCQSGTVLFSCSSYINYISTDSFYFSVQESSTGIGYGNPATNVTDLIGKLFTYERIGTTFRFKVNNVTVKTFTDTVASGNLQIRIATQFLDIVNIKYIELL